MPCAYLIMLFGTATVKPCLINITTIEKQTDQRQILKQKSAFENPLDIELHIGQ